MFSTMINLSFSKDSTIYNTINSSRVKCRINTNILKYINKSNKNIHGILSNNKFVKFYYKNIVF